MKLRFTSRAHRDLDEAMGYYSQKNLRVATELLEAVAQAMIAIKANPLANAKVSTELHRYVMRQFPYGLYYRLAVDEILVVAVMHAKRNPAIWRGRE